MFVQERWNRIVDLLDQNGRATVEELAEVLRVSPGTIRRDLRQMQQAGVITRARGGAIRREQVGLDRPVAENREYMVAEKEMIGTLAAGLIEPGDTVMIDGGSTTFEVIRRITARDVTVITTSMDAIASLKSNPQVGVVVIGGMLRKHDGSTIGPVARRQLAALYADKAILGTNGLSVQRGLTTPSPWNMEIKRMMIRQARETIVVADHTKLGAISLHWVAPTEVISRIVTDSGATEDQIRPFNEAGIQVLRADGAEHV
jgi:DeoR/GlpR family transcriptional regulator of sugar metabolism